MISQILGSQKNLHVRGDGTEGDLVIMITMMIVLIPLMMIEDDIVDTHDIFSDWPGGSFLRSYDLHYCEDDDCPYPHDEIFSDWPSGSLLRQHPRFKACLWSRQGEAGRGAVNLVRNSIIFSIIEILSIIYFL